MFGKECECDTSFNLLRSRSNRSLDDTVRFTVGADKFMKTVC